MNHGIENRAGIVGAIVEFTPATLTEALEVYHEQILVKLAGSHSESMAGLPTVMLMESIGFIHYVVFEEARTRSGRGTLPSSCKQVRAD